MAKKRNELKGRVNERSELLSCLRDHGAGLEIVGVSGFGGVGKTYLVRHVLEELEPEKDKALVIWVDGGAEDLRHDFMRLINEGLAPLKIAGVPKSSRRDFFPHIRRLARIHATEVERVEKKIKKGLEERKEEARERFEAIASVLLKMGAVLNPPFAPYAAGLDLIGGDELAGDAAALIVEALDDPSRIPGPIRDVLGITYRRKVTTQLFNLTAEELVSDLSAILTGYSDKDRWKKFTHSPVKGFDRLFLVIDDFEIIRGTILPFLLNSFLPALKSATFSTQILIIGRDDLQTVNPGFHKDFGRNIAKEIRLEPFPPGEATQFLIDADYSESEAAELVRQFEGYPFLLVSLAEKKDRSALFYQHFFERTTRWMTAVEKGWFLSLCYLDVVNEASISEMIDGADAKQICDWFVHEASIRDNRSRHFVVNPFIREMVHQHHQNLIGIREQTKLKERGAEAVKSAG